MEFTDDIIETYFKDPIFLDELNILVKKLLIDNFKLSNVGKSVHYKILSLLITSYFEFGIEEYKISELKRKLGNVSWKKLYAILYGLADKGIIVLDAKAKTIRLSGCTINTIFNLIKAVQNFDTVIDDFFNQIDKKDLKLSDYKALAKRFLEDKSYLTYFEKSILYGLFIRYLDDANITKIVLKKKDAKELGENDLLILDYKTRFNNEGILKKQIVKLKNIIKEATKHYQYALFITLTTNPNEKNILEGFKEISKAFKKFRDAVSKRLGEQIKYIKVLEFTKSGLPHLHVLIFTNQIKDKKGDWVLSQKWISRIWAKYGFGEITYIYALVRRGDTYTWLNFKPPKAKTDNIANYLSKYLDKAFREDLELMYYWVSNLRFYTYSYSLYREQKQKKHKGIWEFVGCCKEDELMEFIEKLKEFIENRNKSYNRDYLERWYNAIERQYNYWWVG